MKSLEDFLKNETPKRKVSKLKELENEIVQLYNQGYQVEQIQKFLSENKISTERSNVYKFLKKTKNKSATISGGEVKKASSEKPIKEEVKSGIDTNKWIKETIARATKS